MEVEGIRGPEVIKKIEQILKNKVDKGIQNIGKKDGVELSEEAGRLKEWSKFTQKIQQVPNIREDRVEEVRLRIQSDFYTKNQTAVMKEVTERLKDHLL